MAAIVVTCLLSTCLVSARGERPLATKTHEWLEVLAVALLLASLVFAQGAPRLMSVEPSSGKVNDNVALTGDKLGKDSVSAVFLSDEKDDFKAVVVEQTDNKIIIKVPQVKPANYNVSLQVGDKIFIEPVRFKVQQ